MKNHPLSKMGLIFLCALSVCSGAAFAENCVEGITSLNSNPDVHSRLTKFGGIEGIAGEWKLKGLMGVIAKTNVEFKIQDDSFFVRINRDPLKQVWICQGENADVVKVKILKPKYPKNGTILLKAASDDQVQIAASSSGWRFMKFKKIASPRPSKSASFIASEK